MYSFEEKKHAIELYVKYDKSCAATTDELGYPCRMQLLTWYETYVKQGDEGLGRNIERYSPAQRRIAVDYFSDHGRRDARTRRALGYPKSFDKLREWIEELEPEKCGSRRAARSLAYEQKKDAVIDLETRRVSAREVADAYGVERCTIYNLKRELLGKERRGRTNGGNRESDEVCDLRREVDDLEEKTRRLELEKDILEGTVEILRKDQGVDPTSLTNKEKAELADALRPKHMLKEILYALGMAKSSYQYRVQTRRRPDKYAETRIRIAETFAAGKHRYGYRRVRSVLRDDGVRISEKVVCGIMGEDGLAAKRGRKRRHGSYVGGLSEAPANIVARNSHADAPNEIWLTDVTESGIPAGKVYLSPIIDCFDGMVVSWALSTSPSADMTMGMPGAAPETLDADQGPVIHSDRGGHHGWPGWIGLCEKSGLIRSMSKKGCSPDDSAMEGFFGRSEVEMFYGEKWSGWSVADFMDRVDAYIRWHDESRVKRSLGGLSPAAYRRRLGFAA